ncbi:hypothetical protein B4U79_19061 [Dinothrombium tinctorium]|uniref:TATA-box-binding protein-like protein n=1 Tax=Dinothrombium tinctorium TaxID=1965070 RepID=A0A3S3NV98_9ACAR|nr:hypothetical protein B4U79_19061 [Dinothrombium tinctorium]
MVQLQNITVSGDLGIKINLNNVANTLNLNMIPSRFKRIQLKIVEPKCNVFVYSNGKYVILGLNKFGDLKFAIYKLKEKLKSCGHKINKISFNISNLVFSDKLPFRINLNEIHRRKIGTYEPELFPNAVVKIKDITFLIFHTGKVIITGSNDTHLINKTFNEIKNELSLCQAFDEKRSIV